MSPAVILCKIARFRLRSISYAGIIGDRRLKLDNGCEQFRPAIPSYFDHHKPGDEHPSVSFRSSELSQPI
jgi:hypothetical protein